VVTGGLDVQGGNVVLQNDETISNDVYVIITATATTIVAAGELVTTGGLDVQGGDITLENDEVISNAKNGTIEFTGAATTSGAFGATGAITTGGALDVQGGNITLENDETISNAENGLIELTGAATVSGAFGATGAITTASTLDVQGGDITMENDDTLGNPSSGLIDITATAVRSVGNLSVIGTLGSTGAITTASTLDVGDDITFENGESIGNDDNGVLLLTATDVVVSNFINYAPQTPILIADDGYLTPTGTFQGIYAAGSIGFSDIETTGYSDGDILVLYNTVAQTIVITDENNTNLTGNLTLGIGDIVTLIYTNTAWWETSASDN